MPYGGMLHYKENVLVPSIRVSLSCDEHCVQPKCLYFG